MRVLLLDNYDSFTYNLADYLQRLGAEVTVVRNDVCSAAALKTKFPFEALVLSPGPETPAKAGNLMSVVVEYHSKVPIFGVCLGHQALGQFFGAELQKAEKPMHGKTSHIHHSETSIFASLPQPLVVMRYHSLLLQQLAGTPLRETASTQQGECMAFEHNQLPIWGVQFHPESIGTPDGLQLLGNWLRLASVSSNQV